MSNKDSVYFCVYTNQWCQSRVRRAVLLPLLVLSLLFLVACRSSTELNSTPMASDSELRKADMRSVLYVQRELLQWFVASHQKDASLTERREASALLMAYCELLRRGAVAGSRVPSSCESYVPEGSQQHCLADFRRRFRVPGRATSQCPHCVRALVQCLEREQIDASVRSFDM